MSRSNSTISNRKQLFILSLGQIIRPELHKTVDAIASSIGRSKTYIWISYLIDKIWYGTIDEYNKGQIDDECFHQRICNQLRTNTKTYTKEEFTNDWNQMCDVIFVEPKINMQTLENVQEDRHAVLIFSNTNKMHFNFIKEKIENNFSKFVTSLSFEKHTLDRKQLVMQGLKDYRLDGELYDYVSIHKDITEISEKKIPCLPYKSNIIHDHINDVISIRKKILNEKYKPSLSIITEEGENFIPNKKRQKTGNFIDKLEEERKKVYTNCITM